MAIPWIHHDAKVTIILPSTNNEPHQGILDLTENEWFFYPGRQQLHPPIPLPDFLQNAQVLINNNKLFKGWISKKRAITARGVQATSNVLSSLIVKGKVSAKSLEVQKTPSLLHHHKLCQNDQDIWDAAYKAQYDGLQNIETWELITDQQYQQMIHLYKGLLPTMAITTIKKDGKGNPTRAKYHIVVLDNLNPNNWSKQDCFAPVLSQLELRLLISIAVKKKSIPKIRDITQAFCQSYLPNNKHYICIPPPGCLLTPPNTFWKLKKALYGLKRSPRHFYNFASKLLQQLGLKQHPASPCLFTGTILPGKPPLYLGLYVNDFLYFSKSPEVKETFKTEFSKLISIEWKRDLDYFLSISFDCQQRHPDNHVTIKMHQEAFVDHL